MGERGSVVIALLFALLLAASGLALLTHSGIHLRIVAARKDRRLAGAALEQSLLLALHRYRAALSACDVNALDDPLTSFFNEAVFPGWSEDGLAGSHEFSCREGSGGDGFRVDRVLDLIRVRRLDGRLAYAGRAGVDLLSGDIPVTEIGLLVAGPGAGDAAAFLAARGVEYSGSQLPLVGEYPVRIAAGSLLCEALGLPIQVPDWRSIRGAVGLEAGDGPIPPGIYLARKDGDVAAVFVEGHLQKLELEAGEGWQAIRFHQDGRDSELRYRPGQDSLVWSGDAGVTGARFGEKIVVHGSVWSVEQAGAAAFLDDARIELLASGRLVVGTGLVGENLRPGGTKFPGLLLAAGGDFFGGAADGADVVITAPGTATIQAQVIAAGALVNGGGRVEISGGLLASGIENDGSLRIAGAAGEFELGRRVILPAFKLLKNFRVHFIEEESDGE